MIRLISLKVRPIWLGLLVGFSMILTACGSAAGTQTSSKAVPVTGEDTIQIANNPNFGQVLVTSDGKTLYANTVDSPSELRCVNIACTGFWQPYTVDAQPTGQGQVAGSLGTVTRPDGTQQVTYNQQPLYTFYLDKQAGDAKGNGFTDFGGTWHVVTLGRSPVGTSTGNNNEPGIYQP